METNNTEKKTKEKGPGLGRSFEKIWDSLTKAPVIKTTGGFEAAMNVADQYGGHKMENWSKSPKKTAQVIRNTVSKSATVSTVIPPTGKVPQEEEDWTRYILVKGLPIPNDSEDVYPRLTIMTVGGKLYFDDFVYDKDIVIAFEEKSTKFPVPISIGIEFEDASGLTFTRMGEFPDDSEIKRVVVDLSAPGRSIEGASKKSQRSIKRFMHGISKARKKKAEEERDSWPGISATAISATAVLVSSAMNLNQSWGSGSGSGILSNSHSATISLGLDDDLDLTDAMEESVEELIDKRIGSLQELIDQKVKDAVNDLKSDITNGIVEKHTYSPDGDVDVAKLTASVCLSGGVSKWQAEERVKKLLKGDYDDPGIN